MTTMSYRVLLSNYKSLHVFSSVFTLLFIFAECECNTLGTYDNQGCDQFTGECTCKRFVTGRNCDQCLVGRPMSL